MNVDHFTETLTAALPTIVVFAALCLVAWRLSLRLEAANERRIQLAERDAAEEDADWAADDDWEAIVYATRERATVTPIYDATAAHIAKNAAADIDSEWQQISSGERNPWDWPTTDGAA